MKLITLFTLIIFSVSSYADSPLNAYTGTTWVNKTGEYTVQFLSSESSGFSDGIRATIKVTGLDLFSFTRLEYFSAPLESNSDWIHKGQDIISFYINSHSDGPVIGLFVADETCLLFPDTEAPDECLKLQE